VQFHLTAATANSTSSPKRERHSTIRRFQLLRAFVWLSSGSSLSVLPSTKPLSVTREHVQVRCRGYLRIQFHVTNITRASTCNIRFAAEISRVQCTRNDGEVQTGEPFCHFHLFSTSASIFYVVPQTFLVQTVESGTAFSDLGARSLGVGLVLFPASAHPFRMFLTASTQTSHGYTPFWG